MEENIKNLLIDFSEYITKHKTVSLYEYLTDILNYEPKSASEIYWYVTKEYVQSF